MRNTYSAVRVSSNKKGALNYQYEHRLIMEKSLGRKLKRTEVVHHKNGNKLDNSRSNLEVMKISDHLKHHARERKKHSETESCVNVTLRKIKEIQ